MWEITETTKNHQKRDFENVFRYGKNNYIFFKYYFRIRREKLFLEMVWEQNLTREIVCQEKNVIFVAIFNQIQDRKF